ncbi:hypothetical protein BDP27DRAFT_1208383 [Rhodocollybia butyracea]|uniref:intramembrane prenyl-peptidase Rce1 n=1 Tax=Rhodocollybia butyracea TaxID=206335 RepID=A0A9P5Q9R8_9AGAR|nr:hypothetical protein BDP27DRAFT_1208383 [Rhodocollybia butyracea]
MVFLVPPQPLMSTTLSPHTAHLLGVAFASIYVGSIYVLKTTRLVFTTQPTKAGPADKPRERMRAHNERWRDDPDVIKSRITAVSIATVLCVGIICWIHQSVPVALAGLGLWPFLPSSLSSIYCTLAPHLVTPLLFLGPLYASFLSSSSRYDSLAARTRTLFFNWAGLRNYVVAPITEEIVFRACVLSVYQLSPKLASSKASLVFTTPLNFGLAHLHHAWETYNRFGRTQAALKRAILSSVFQMAYTTLFGAHCAYLFLQTGHSIFVPITAHVFCNIMGFPEFAEDLRTGESEGRKGRVVSAYLIGVVGFAYLLMPAGRWLWCA